MFKTTVKYLLLLTFFAVFAASNVFAQATITIGAVDAGPYSPGSTIAIPFHVNDATGCIGQTNTFTLYRSDASGDLTSPVQIGTPINSFYSTFINYTLPTGAGALPAGNYKFVIRSSTAGVAQSAPSNAVVVNTTAGTPVVASVTTTSINAGNPEVFGQCSGPATSYFFSSNSTGAISTTATFFNEATQTPEVTNQAIGGAYNFTSNPVTYTVIARAINAAGTVSTKAFLLINNKVSTSIGFTGDPTVCISGGAAPLTYNIDITSATGIQNNYPGNLYTFSWGDGTPNTVLTLCDIKALNGQITHPYTTPSCGNLVNGQNNSFEVNFTAANALCGSIGGRQTSYARIVITPTNLWEGPASGTACTGSAVTFINRATTGPDPNSTTNGCLPNPNARFIWLVDGVIQGANYTTGQNFVYTFTTNGVHTVTLRAQNGNGACIAVDYSNTICIQNAPQPSFTLPTVPVCLTDPVIPTNTSVIDNGCTPPVYTWLVFQSNGVTAATGVTYLGGTNANSVTPQFKFANPGVYKLQLRINTVSCGPVLSTQQTLTVDTAPVAQLQADFSLCGKSYTLAFDNTAGSLTKTILTGTTTTDPAATYTWTVTGGVYNFAGGTTSHSQYPKIYFDNFSTYTVTVTHTNSCGTVSDSQVITFAEAPTVDAGLPQVSCEGTGPVHLTGVIGGTYNNLLWTKDSPAVGTLSSPTSLTTDYTPTAADFIRGYVTLVLHAYTSAPAPCNEITDGIVITFVKTTVVNPGAKSICSGDKVNYTITTNNDALTPAPTFAWTASVTSGAATGFTASGTGNFINDLLVNTDRTVTSTVTYHIIPTTNGCPGTPYDFIVTLPAVPIAAPTKDSPVICSGAPANINLASNQASAKYTWTVAAGAVTGAHAQSTLSTTKITDALVNNTTGVITVTYTITPYNSNNCPGDPVDISVDVYPATPAANAGPAQQNCNSPVALLAGNAVASPFSGMWTQTAGPAAIITDATNPATTVTGLVGGSNYTFTWTISSPYPCGSTANSVTITNNAATVGGTTSGTATVCSGSNNGTITLAGRVGTVVRWEKSINGTTWTTVANISDNISYTNLTATTQYRAVVKNLTCNEEVSSVTIITVNPVTPAANPGPAQILCNAATTFMAAVDPGASFTGQWTQETGDPVTIVDPTNRQTQITGLVGGKNYSFRWTVNGLAPCGPTSAVMTVTNNAATVGGTTSGTATICSGTNTGPITLAGNIGAVVRWEKSIDNGITWVAATPANTTTTFTYNNLTVTTQYRAVVKNFTCNEEVSAVTIITVNPGTPAADAGPAQILCNAPSTLLIAADPGVQFTGQWTQESGDPVTIVDPTNHQTQITGLVGGKNYSFRWTVNGLAPCGPTSAVVTVTNNAATVGGTTSGTAAVCAGGNTGPITLTGNVGAVLRWELSTDGGATWATATPANTTTTFTYNNLTVTTQYRAVVKNFTCNQEVSSVTTVTVNPPVPPAVAGANQVLCNVTMTTLDATPPGGTFVGQWTQTGGPAGPVITNPNDPKTTVTGLVGDNTYTFTWSILASAPCTNTSSSMTVNVSAATVAGNTTGGTTVCAGSNAGQVTLTGYHGSILYWEKSEDRGANWIMVNNTTAILSYLNITTTTQYRAYVRNGSCTTLISPLTVITVNQPAPPADAGPNQILCNQASVNLVANDPGTFIGTWTQTAGPAANIVNPNSFQTVVNGLLGGNTYTFTWTIKVQAPCVDTHDDVTITNKADVMASFTANTKIGCGDLTVNFTNTSNNQTGANFIWNFGDGQTSSLASPQHTFAQRNDGRDTTYYISLGVIGNCIQRPAIVDSILVRPAAPIARILPLSANGCGNFALEVRNTSPGNNVSYDFYLYDGTTLVQRITKTDKTNAIFDPINTAARKVFTLYMVATGYCNNTTETTHIPISISPSSVVAQMFINGGAIAGCMPYRTTFINNSFGGDNFFYTIYDSNNNIVDKPIGGLAPLPYTFARAGTYYVTITAVSNCGFSESGRTRVDVYASPTPAFVADMTTACKDALITFTNNTVTNDVNTSATSLLYDWDFGDGSAHSALFAPTHAYHYTGTAYTVTLRATNTTSGCSDVIVKTAYIALTGPPKTAFSISPDSVTSIPNYTFSFVDRTQGGAVSWKWTFGNGQTSTRQNPTITYADTGVYRVTLTTATAIGCDSSLTRIVRIGGVPGQLFLPNAFIPESVTSDLRIFKAKGSGIKTWHLQIFNNYGQLIWETTKLDAKGEPVDGWDGTFKGVPVPQGVYQWQASATFINGTEWKGNSYRDELPKRVGSIHLIR